MRPESSSYLVAIAHPECGNLPLNVLEFWITGIVFIAADRSNRVSGSIGK
jgi:hypothetical protein